MTTIACGRSRTTTLLLLLSVTTSLASAQERADPERKLAELGITLPTGATPLANYVPWTQSGNQVWLAGHVSATVGKLGANVSPEEGYAAAKDACVRLLGTLKAAAGGDLRRVQRILKVNGFVNGTPEFVGQSQVINGCSDLLVAVFGDAGRHARAAVGVASLPTGRAVEIDLVAELVP
ncbi:MAG: RidA family protein [Gemmatimonadota bacterium]|nr:RidA family protein [Gemmatimonadota bacterium]